MNGATLIQTGRWVCLTLLLSTSGLVRAADKSGERMAKIHVCQTVAQKKTETSTRIAFNTGKPAIIKVAGTDADDRKVSLAIEVNSVGDKNPMQYLVEVTIKEQLGQNEPTVLSAPKLIVDEGASASIEIGELAADGSKNGLSIDVIIESQQ